MAGNCVDMIIRQAAAEILIPEGVFQRGKSRIWMDDNGWFLTVIDFSRGTWGKGSHLRVGVHFLWNDTEDISLDLGGKEENSVTFATDEASFALQMQTQLQTAMELVRYYRTFSDLVLAEKMISLENSGEPLCVWNKMMICFLNRSAGRARAYHKEVVETTADSYQPGAMELHQMATHAIAPIISNQGKCMQYVLGLIRANRQLLRGKSNMAHLKENTKFG